MSNERVRHQGTSGELMLTNLNLVFIKTKGLFRTTYIPVLYPIRNIKKYNEKAQLILGNDGSISIQFRDGQETFEFWNDDVLFSEKKAAKEASRWAQAIDQLINGQVPDTIEPADPSRENVEVIAESLKDTIDIFKTALGAKSTAKSKAVAAKCSACQAPVSGLKGQIVHCQYCGSKQEL